MKTTKVLISQLVYDFRSERWNEFELPKLSLRELHPLAKLLGCPCHGTKETLIIRLLAQRELRFKLACFTDNPGALASSYRRDSLRDMCREAGISAGLLNWRKSRVQPLPQAINELRTKIFGTAGHIRATANWDAGFAYASRAVVR